MVSHEIPSQDWSLDIGLDGLEWVGFPPNSDCNLFVPETLDPGAIDGSEEEVRHDLVTWIWLDHCDLTATVDKVPSFRFSIKHMRTHVHAKSSYFPFKGHECGQGFRRTRLVSVGGFSEDIGGSVGGLTLV